jgi:hypothetical protein
LKRNSHAFYTGNLLFATPPLSHHAVHLYCLFQRVGAPTESGILAEVFELQAWSCANWYYTFLFFFLFFVFFLFFFVFATFLSIVVVLVGTHFDQKTKLSTNALSELDRLPSIYPFISGTNPSQSPIRLSSSPSSISSFPSFPLLFSPLSLPYSHSNRLLLSELREWNKSG